MTISPTNHNFIINQQIWRTTPDTSTYGATGRIVEIGEGVQAGRIRVMWLKSDGTNDKRTWIKPDQLTATEITEAMQNRNRYASRMREINKYYRYGSQAKTDAIARLNEWYAGVAK